MSFSFHISISLFLFFGLIFLVSDSKKLEKFQQVSELDPAELVIVKTPKTAAKFGYHPKGFLYEETPNSEVAKKSHKKFVKVMTKEGVKVVKIDKVFRKLSHEKLEEIAFNFLQYQLAKDSKEVPEKLLYYLSDEHKRDNLRKMSKKQLIDIIFEQPTVIINMTTDLEATHVINRPSANLLFTRDQQIVTAKGLVLGNFGSRQRTPETELMKIFFQILGIPIIGEVPSPARLEGGDFIPFSRDLAFLGVGFYTNMQGANYLMENDLLGSRRLAVVYDEFDMNIQHMHLDTIFNIADESRVVLLDTVIGNTSKIPRIVREYVQNEDSHKYELKREVEFSQFLKEEGFQIIPITDQQQHGYITNFLNLGKRHNGKCLIISVHPDLEKILKEAGYEGKVIYVDYSGITTM
ncbi:arginine deiminase [Anaeramoeba ignava]|uniref:Arginine deiminase n=1 Tax=Anaeramoeba ignava TaxID=1746090 RepID=A0A9Q0LH46_ANAIG|nr:arginine deiminase [Anaeramoeba ignava]